MKRAGFTMIELIFVIVILGILAAVAVPKLAATRDDAKIAKGASSVSTAVTDIGSHYTAQGSMGNWADMTNVDFKLAAGGDIASDTNSTIKVFISDGAGTNCTGYVVSATDGNLTVTADNNSTAVCKGINSAAGSVIKLHQFGGTGVNW